VAETKYTYSIQDDFPDHVVDSSKLTADVRASSIEIDLVGVNTAGDVCDIVFVAALSPTDEATLDSVVAAHAVALYIAKRTKQGQIDIRTQELISEGFIYDGHRFSLSDQAQMNIVGLKTPIDMGWVTFPHKMSTTEEDTPEYEVADANAFNAVYAQAVGTVKAHMDSGRALKKLVAACTTVAEVDAVEDTR
jgi:hypothetical protein